jgi:hypothetical protein
MKMNSVPNLCVVTNIMVFALCSRAIAKANCHQSNERIRNYLPVNSLMATHIPNIPPRNDEKNVAISEIFKNAHTIFINLGMKLKDEMNTSREDLREIIHSGYAILSLLDIGSSHY